MQAILNERDVAEETRIFQAASLKPPFMLEVACRSGSLQSNIYGACYSQYIILGRPSSKLSPDTMDLPVDSSVVVKAVPSAIAALVLWAIARRFVFPHPLDRIRGPSPNPSLLAGEFCRNRIRRDLIQTSMCMLQDIFAIFLEPTQPSFIGVSQNVRLDEAELDSS